MENEKPIESAARSLYDVNNVWFAWLHKSTSINCVVDYSANCRVVEIYEKWIFNGFYYPFKSLTFGQARRLGKLYFQGESNILKKQTIKYLLSQCESLSRGQIALTSNKFANRKISHQRLNKLRSNLFAVLFCFPPFVIKFSFELIATQLRLGAYLSMWILRDFRINAKELLSFSSLYFEDIEIARRTLTDETTTSGEEVQFPCLLCSLSVFCSITLPF